MQKTPRSNRLTIGFFGRRNAGKSSLINAFSGQEVSIVSDTPGTTADPVYKSMELLPLGPVTLVDTAGLDDDDGALGAKRAQASLEALKRTDLAVLVCTAGQKEYELEEFLLQRCREEKIPVVIAVNKEDRAGEGVTLPPAVFADHAAHPVSALRRLGLDELRKAVIAAAPENFETPRLVADVLPGPGSLVLLVAPQDVQAPKGRLILPQVQVIRDLLDAQALVVTTGVQTLEAALGALARRPDLVICDSQVFAQVVKKIPDDVPLTSFSIIMARAKGDLAALVAGAQAIERLRPGDSVLVAEACTHHPMENDIARVQLPQRLARRAGGELKVDVCAGGDFPKELGKYRLILQCGGCMLTRRAFLARMETARKAGVPITNYGVALGYLTGILPRVTEVFLSSRNTPAEAGAACQSSGA